MFHRSSGVDLAQVRAFLALTPAERLRMVEEFVSDLLAILEANR
jgi:hypothetical protein